MNISINRRITLAVTGLLLVGLLWLVGGATQKAEAHTSLKSVSANSKVLRITFNGPIRRGTIRATNARGKVISRGSGGRDPRNVNRLVVALKSVRSGVYTARWSIVAIDGHHQAGTVRFRVR